MVTAEPPPLSKRSTGCTRQDLVREHIASCTTLCTECPTSVKVTPSSGPYKAGDVLTCTSDGYPEPSYTWTDSVSGVVVSTGPNITLTNSSFVLNCTATVNVTDACSASVGVHNTGMLKEPVACLHANSKHLVTSQNKLMSTIISNHITPCLYFIPPCLYFIPTPKCITGVIVAATVFVKCAITVPTINITLKEKRSVYNEV